MNLRTEGLRAAAVRAEGAGSLIVLKDATAATLGDGAAGLSSANGGYVQASDISIETSGAAANGAEALNGRLALERAHIVTRGALSHGLSVAGGDAQIVDSVIEIAGSQANGLDVNGGTLLAERVRIDIAGSGAGLWAGGSSATTLRSVQINGTGAGASGALVALGSKAVLEDVDIALTHDRSGTGLLVGGELEMRGGSVHAGGANASALSFATSGGGKATLDGVDLSGHFGINLMEGSELTLRNSHLQSQSIGIDINQRNGIASISDSSITTRDGVGIRMLDNGQLELTGSQVTSDGLHGQAVSILGGEAHIASSALHTLGESGHGIFAEASIGRTPVVAVEDTRILTEGEMALGVIARSGAVVSLADSEIRTTGRESHGVLTGGNGEMSLANTHVRTEGEGAWAAVVNDNGKLSIDGGSLVSAQHGGIWMRSSRDPGLTLTNGAVVSGGNGIALALDAAVAGRFDVKLEGGSQMIGDIVITPEDEDAGLVPQSQVHMLLSDGALWQGSSQLVQGMALDGGSQWTLTGDATVQDLAVRDSLVALSDGNGRFNVLTVDGDLHSEGATFLFNGALGGDTSAIDRLHVRGDASGNASIVVNNIGGVGAPTFDGIQLVRIDGASLADYALAGRAVGGAYEYFLFKGGLLDPNDGNWYLRSQWFDICEEDPNAPGCVVDPGPDPDPVDPIDPIDPVDPVNPPPVLRPEAGAYLANQSAAVNMFAHRLSDRMGAVAMGDERAAWARVARSNADFTAVGGQLSVDGNTSVLQIGTDVWRRGNAALGVMLGSGRADNTVVSDLTGYSAKGRVRGTAVGVYGTWLQQADGSEGAYVDAQLQYGRFSNRVQGIALDRESYDSRMRSGSLEGGYTFNVWQGASSNLYLQPQLQLTYTDYDANRHVETNGTVVDGAEAGGLAGRVGVRAFGQRAGMGSVVQPYVGVNWLRSSGRNAIDFRGETLRADLPRNRYEVQAGAELKISHRLGAWGGLNVQRGDHGYRDVSAQVGMRLGW
ncbi:TPA: autotransporter outer membrane beta-barrel domain-containing protein [Stenotrophomonas maltophilia]